MRLAALQDVQVAESVLVNKPLDRKAGRTMKKRQGINPGILVVLMAVATLVLAVDTNYVTAADRDTDWDGFSDAIEIAPFITTLDGDTFPTTADKKDLFVFLWDAVTAGLGNINYLPQDALAFVVDGLVDKVKVHRMERDRAAYPQERRVCAGSEQKAVRIQENSESDLADDNIVGIATWGSPNYHDDAKVFTMRIIETVRGESAGAHDVWLMNAITGGQLQHFDPQDLTPLPPLYPQQLTDLETIYMKHVIAHEVGHCVRLTQQEGKGKLGHHYPAGTGFHMDEHVYFTAKRGVTKWYIPQEYTEQSKADLRLYP